MMMKILFIAYGGGHIASLIPIIKALENQKTFEIKVFGLTTAQDRLKKEGIDCFGYANLPFEPSTYLLNRGEELYSRLDTSKLSREESVAYLGWNMVELEETYGVEKARQMYEGKGRFCFFPLQLMKRIIKEDGIDLVISTNSPRSERAAIEAASSLGIPSLCIVDGFAKYESEWISKPGFADKVCVLSESVKKSLISLGRSEQDILVTGNPAFDTFYSPIEEDKIHAFRKRLGIPTQSKIILYASNPESEFHIFNGKKGDVELPRKTLERLIQFITKREDYTLIFRPHPSQKFEDISYFKRLIFDKDFDLQTILHAADVVVTISSTVGLQAQIVGKPLLCMNCSIYADDIYYEDFGDVMRLNSLDELDEALIRVEADSQVNGMREKHTESATQKIMTLLKNFEKDSQIEKLFSKQ